MSGADMTVRLSCFRHDHGFDGIAPNTARRFAAFAIRFAATTFDFVAPATAYSQTRVA